MLGYSHGQERVAKLFLHPLTLLSVAFIYLYGITNDLLLILLFITDYSFDMGLINLMQYRLMICTLLNGAQLVYTKNN